MAGRKGSLFFVGLALLAQAFYVALSLREQLQAWHHGHAIIPPVQGVLLGRVAAMLPLTAMIAIMAVMVLGGMTLTMIGWVHRFTLKEARLSDCTRYDRYDVYMNTGVPFSHFNHRGTLASKNEQQASAEGNEPAKKKN